MIIGSNENKFDFSLLNLKKLFLFVKKLTVKRNEEKQEV